MTGYMIHITLATGHAARQRREDVGEAAIRAVSELLDAVLQGGHPPVPGAQGYLVSGSHHGRDLIATLWAGPWERRVPILTTAVALRSRSAPALWRLLHEGGVPPHATDPARPPPAPWIADRLEIGALDHPEAAAWTGDWARCLGWAWAGYAR